MANPNSISDLHATNVILLAGGGISTASFSQPLFVSTFPSTPNFPGRIKVYTGSPDQLLAALVADGFGAGDPAYEQVRVALLQPTKPSTIYIGRRDAADADWDEALTAIEAAGNALDPVADWFFLAVDERTMAGIEEISLWVSTRFALFYAQTDDLGVLNNLPANGAELISALNRPSTALTWHDPLTASSFGPATLTSLIGPWNVPAGATLDLQVPTGSPTQSFVFNHGPAIVTGVNTEPFAIADGDVYSVIVNNGDQQNVSFEADPATTTSVPETYALAPGNILSVRVDGAAAVNATFVGTAGSVTTSAEPYVGLAGETLTLRADKSTTNQDITFTAAAVDAASVAAEIDNATSGFTVTVVAGPAVHITSNEFGSESNVRVHAVTATITAQLGLVVGDNKGTGDAEILSQTTAVEAALRIGTDIATLTADGSSGSVALSSNLIGTESRIKVDGGTANVALGFSTVEFSGSGDFGDSTAVEATEVQKKLGDNLSGVIVEVDTGAIKLTTRRSGSSARIEHVASTVVTTLGFTPGVGGAVNGTGLISDGSRATADEIAGIIGLTLTDGIAEALSSALVVSTDVQGPTASLTVIGGTSSLLSQLGLTAGQVFTGTGVTDDFLDAGAIGRCGTFDLDSPGGRLSWDNVGIVGVFPDKPSVITPQKRASLHARNINTYETRAGRAELHFGVLLRDTVRYIDEQTTAEWLDARVTEEFKVTQNRLTNAGVNIDYTNEGALFFDAALRAVGRRADENGHIIFDGQALPPPTPENPLPTGIITPVVAQQSQVNIDGRHFSGFFARWRLRGTIHTTDTIIELRRAIPGEE